MQLKIIMAAIAVSGGIASAAAAADRPESRFYARGGAFFSNVNSSLRLDSNSGTIGTEIDLESDLGLPKRRTLPFGQIGWRFSNDWRVELEYFSLSRDQTRTLDRSITVGDTVYAVNASVTSGLSTDVYRLGVGYSFVNKPNLEIGASLGAHLTDFGVFIEGSGSVNGGAAGAVVRREARNQLVPLPVIGLYGRVPLNDTFTMVGRVDYFALKIDDYKGSLVDTSIGVTARLTDNFGIGADFRYVDYGLSATATDFTGRIDYDFYGPFVYLTVDF